MESVRNVFATLFVRDSMFKVISHPNGFLTVSEKS